LLDVSLSLPPSTLVSFFHLPIHDAHKRWGNEKAAPRRWNVWAVEGDGILAGWLAGKRGCCVRLIFFFSLPFYAIYVRWTIETGDKEENLKSSDRVVWRWRSQLEWQLLQRLAIVVISQFDLHPIQSRYYKPSTIFSFLRCGLGGRGSLSVTLRLIK
jgi:hypothetical protein